MIDDIKSSTTPEDKNIDMEKNYMAVKEPPAQKADTFTTPDKTSKPDKPSRKRRLNLTKKQKIIIGVVVGILVAAIAVWFFVFRSTPKAVETQAVVVEETPAAPILSNLTGLEVTADVNERTVTGIMIENSPDARPQSGLRDAGIVYEAVAEGGITRFLTVFQDTQPEYIGPVRSVRPYYLDFLGPYGAAIAHVGGSGEALAQIKAQDIRDLDQFTNSSAYWRESTRYAPHNVYTNMLKLKDLEKQKGWQPVPYEGFVRGASSEPAATPTAATVNIKMSSTLYNVVFTYDSVTNTYKRAEGGRPHVDAKTNEQLSPKIVVVPIIPRTQNGIYSVYAVNGSGKVLVFQNGTVTEGTWQKSDRKSQFKFTGSDGQPLKLAAGQTWVTMAATGADVTYTP